MHYKNIFIHAMNVILCNGYTIFNHTLVINNTVFLARKTFFLVGTYLFCASNQIDGEKIKAAIP